MNRPRTPDSTIKNDEINPGIPVVVVWRFYDSLITAMTFPLLTRLPLYWIEPWSLGSLIRHIIIMINYLYVKLLYKSQYNFSTRTLQIFITFEKIWSNHRHFVFISFMWFDWTAFHPNLFNQCFLYMILSFQILHMVEELVFLFGVFILESDYGNLY